MSRARPDDLTTDQMVARLAPHIARVTNERVTAKETLRAQFPLMAEMTDLFRDAGMAPRPVYSRNAAGEEWGREPGGGYGVVIDGDKLAHLPEYEAFWKRACGKRAETAATYRERMQRAIKPSMGIE